ncbi:LacI family DNA-binding transcriptional regulator [Rhodococcus jostii]|uniref:LacI family DNA-binding transcriptional regulator n=1 Tax=Rhodococcus jostii TaxID=132919 RepID=A0ABU4CNR9_RHOJO|nr:LacI family DNA-binding transcriptional regulator [Rhodococcus jostii]MDV6284957.1 LacI family DNA-binding transcriptional regulator [Rhodococcus jostii]
MGNDDDVQSSTSGDKRGSIRAVARRADVSASTASRSLRQGTSVSAETREKVLKAARELGYQLPRARTGSPLIAVLTRFPNQWFFAEAIATIEHVLSAQGQRLVLHDVSNPVSRAAFFENALPQGQFDGVIVISATFSPDEQKALLGLAVPGVTIGGYLPGWPTIGIDETAAARAATQHLLGLGHQRLGLLSFETSDPLGVGTTNARHRGFEEALAGSGLTADPRWIVLAEGSRMSGGYAAAEYLLSQPQLPTALFAMSDELAIGALQAFRRAGMSVPGDLSIVGFDDHEMAEFADLTTVAQPLIQQAQLAAERLDPSNHTIGRDTQLAFRLRVRGTSGPPV